MILYCLNTAQLWWPLGPNSRNARAKAVKKYITQNTHDTPYIICLQEVWRKKANDIFAIIARKLNLDFHWYSKAGLFTMVPKHDENQFFDVPYDETIDYPFTHKGFTAVINQNTGLLLVNTHLQAGICKCVRTLFYNNVDFDAIKVQQLTQLTSYVKKIMDQLSPDVMCVCGDFNLWTSKEDEYEAVRKLMEDQLNLTNATNDTEDSVDYVWTLNNVLHFHSDDGTTMSDHPILRVELQD